MDVPRDFVMQVRGSQQIDSAWSEGFFSFEFLLGTCEGYAPLTGQTDCVTNQTLLSEVLGFLQLETKTFSDFFNPITMTDTGLSENYTTFQVTNLDPSFRSEVTYLMIQTQVEFLNNYVATVPWAMGDILAYYTPKLQSSQVRSRNYLLGTDKSGLARFTYV